MSITNITPIESLLNPCRVKSSKRIATYVQADRASYNPTNEIRFSFPTESLDLSNSYINMNIDIPTTDPEIEQIILIDSVVAPGVYPITDAGGFQIKYGGSISAQVLFSTTCELLEDIINAMPGFSGRGYNIVCANFDAVAPYVTGTNNVAQGIKLIVSNFVWDEVPESLGWEMTNNSSTLVGAYVPLFFDSIQEGELSYPRLESGNPLITSIRFTIGGEEIMNFSNLDILGSLVHLMQKNGDRYYDFEVGSESINGEVFNGQFRVKINLTDYMPIFRKILPLEQITQKFKVYLTLGTQQKCLIWKTENPSVTPTYTVSDIEFHYNKIEFSNEEISQISSALNSNSLVIPMIGYTNTTDSATQGLSTKDVIFSTSSKSLLGIMAVMQSEPYVSNPTNTRKSSTFLKNKIYSARLKTGGIYHPADIIKSINNDKSDVSEYIEEFINTAPYILGEQTRDMRLFYNYSGNYTENKVFIEAWGTTFPPTFCIGISTAGTPHDNFGHICQAGKGYSGLDVSGMNELRLELRGLELLETTNINLFTISQRYLVFGRSSFRIV